MCCHWAIRILLASWKTLSPSQWRFIASNCLASLLCSRNHTVCIVASPGCSLARCSPLAKHFRLGSSQKLSQLWISLLVSEHFGSKALPLLLLFLFSFKNGELLPSLTFLNSKTVLPYVWLASNQVVISLFCSLVLVCWQFGIAIPCLDLKFFYFLSMN